MVNGQHLYAALCSMRLRGRGQTLTDSRRTSSRDIQVHDRDDSEQTPEGDVHQWYSRSRSHSHRHEPRSRIVRVGERSKDGFIQSHKQQAMGTWAVQLATGIWSVL